MEKIPFPQNILRNRKIRFYTSVILMLAIFLICKSHFSFIVSSMLSWLAFAISQLVFSWIVFFSFHPSDVKAFAKEEDSSISFIFLFVVSAAFVSLFAIFYLLQTNTSRQGFSLHILISISSVLFSWILIHTLFTMRYAHLYYNTTVTPASQASNCSPLSFPGEDKPDYLDFAYFSFVLGMTFQVSDVQINSKAIRRLALLHSFLSFIYNTVIVAFSINIISGLISK